MNHFVVSKVTNLSQAKEGDRYETSDFATITPEGNFVQMKYIAEEDEEPKFQPYKVKPGLFTIEVQNNSFVLVKTELLKDDILESFLCTKEVTDKADCFFNNVDKYKKWGREVAKRCILLFGPAGSGKSTSINAITRKYTDDKTAIIIWNTTKQEPHQVKDFFKSFEYVGVERVILIAEDIGGVEMEEARLRSDPSLLGLLDNQDKAFTIPTLILCTTNHPEMFLANLTKRPNRIDDKIHVGYPNAEQRVALLKFFMKKADMESNINDELLKTISDKICNNFTPAHIQEALIRSDIYSKPVSVTIRELVEENKKYDKGFHDSNPLGIL